MICLWKLQLHWYWWQRYVDDFRMASVLEWIMLVRIMLVTSSLCWCFLVYLISHQYLISVTKIPKLSLTHLVPASVTNIDVADWFLTFKAWTSAETFSLKAITIVATAIKTKIFECHEKFVNSNRQFDHYKIICIESKTENNE